MPLLHSLTDFTRNCFAIWTKLPGRLVRRRSRILNTYLHLRETYIFQEKILRRKIQNEEFLGFKVEFFNYIHLVHLFEENFARNEYFFPTKKDQPLIVDCGANLGDTILYFKWLYPHARIISFEPDPKNFALLAKNVAANHLKDVKIYNFALSGKEGKFPFFFNPENPGSGHESLFQSNFEGRKKVRSKVMVSAKKLSSYINGPVDFLKMDIEGAEKNVLPELAKSGKLKFVRQIAIEYHHHLTENDDQLGKLLSILEKEGFSYSLSTDLKPPFEMGGFQDILIVSSRR